MLNIIGFYLDGTDGTLTGVHVSLVVHRRTRPCLQFLQQLRQLFQRLALQTGSQFGVLWHWRQLIALQHGLDIQSRTATKDRPSATLSDVFISIKKVLLIQNFKDIDDDDLKDVDKICVTAGASTPPALISEVIDYLRKKTGDQLSD